MLNVLRKIFKKEEKIVEQVSQDELAKWFEGKVTILNSEYNKKLSSLKRELIQKIIEAEKTLRILKDATLRNPKISTRELQFMEGNRRSYLQRTAFFLKEVREIIDDELAFFLSSYQEHIENFAKSTEKAYRILQEFFADESGKIAQAVKDIDSTVEKLKNDEQIHNYSKIEKIRKDILSIENRIKKEDELAAEIAVSKKTQSGLKSEIVNLQNSRNNVLSSKEYEKFEFMEEKKQRIEAEIRSLQNSFSAKFSIISRALRKYQRIAFQHDKLIEKYADDPIGAIVIDSRLSIMEILAGITSNMKDNKLQLKEKKSEKVLETIKDMDKEYFSDFQKKYIALLKEKTQLELDISQAKAKIELDKVNSKLEIKRNQERELRNKTDSMRTELSSIDIGHMRDRLKQEMEDLLKIRIEYVNGKDQPDKSKAPD